MALIVKEPRRVEDDDTLATLSQEKAFDDRITVVSMGGRPAVRFYRHHTDGVVNSGKRCELKLDQWSHQRALTGMYTQFTSLYLPNEWKAKMPLLNGTYDGVNPLYYVHLQQWAAGTGTAGTVPPFTLTLCHRGLEVWDWVTNGTTTGWIVLGSAPLVFDRWMDIMVEAKWRLNRTGAFRLAINGHWVVYKDNYKTAPDGSTLGPKWGEGMYWGAGEYPFDDGCTVYKAGYKLLQGYGDGFPQCGFVRPVGRSIASSRTMRAA